MPRRLLYVVPTVAALIAGFALVGPGKARGIDAVRVFAAPDVDGRFRSLRVVAAHREDQIDTPLRGEVRASSGDAGSFGDLQSNGAAEIKLARPLGPGDELVVATAGRTLARGKLRETSGESLSVPPPCGGKHDGALHVSPRFTRGPLVPPFGGELAADVADGEGKPIPATFELHLEGATCPNCKDGAAAAPTFAATITPVADQVEIDLTAHAADGRTGSFVGKVSTAMGSLWLAPTQAGKLRVVAATPKDWAFASLFDDRGRVSGRIIPLSEHDGFYEGSIEETPNEQAARYVILSSDESEAGRTTTAWVLGDSKPTDPAAEPKTLPRLVRVLDGFPDASKRESERLRRVHFILAGFVVALAFVEIGLLGLLARGTRRDLATHFDSSFGGADEPAPRAAIQPVRSMLVVVFVVALVVALSAAALVGLTLFTK